MSLGSPYGQPEDDLTHFANIASYYGSVVVVSAGNSADEPYILGSPSAAAGAISVAQSTRPVRQALPDHRRERYGRGRAASLGATHHGPDLRAAAVWRRRRRQPARLRGVPGRFAGRARCCCVDRGICAISIKGANGSAAGAVMVLVANNSILQHPADLQLRRRHRHVADA